MRRAKHVGVWLADGDEGRKEKKEVEEKIKEEKNEKKKDDGKDEDGDRGEDERVMMPMVMMTTMAMAMMMAPPTRWRGTEVAVVGVVAVWGRTWS